jgi:biopolymer transport protein ExbB
MERELAGGGLAAAEALMTRGGPAIWAIVALSVVTVAVILWKLWRLMRAGVWRRVRAERALALWRAGARGEARGVAAEGAGVCARVVAAAMAAAADLPEAAARDETGRVAKRHLAEARSGLRALELIALIAPLLGLLGTVLGMIAAFQALQAAGGAADPSDLAGGIWEALLTTAAGMGVAIPAAVALTWFESVVDRLRLDLEDMATRVFAVPGAVSDGESDGRAGLARAAE